MKAPNKITGANAGGPRRWQIRTSRAAHIAQFRRSPMRLPRVTLAWLPCLGVAILTWQASAASEPTYRGRSLSEWLGHCYQLHAHEVSLHERPPLKWMFPDDYDVGGDQEAISAVRAIGAEALPTLLRLIRAADGESNDRALAGFAVLKDQARTAIPSLLVDSRSADKDLSSRAMLALIFLRQRQRPWASDATVAKSVGRDLILFAEQHGGVFPESLADAEISGATDAPDNYWDQEVWPLVRYWPPNGPPASNHLLLAWPTPGGWVCVRANLTTEVRREIPESANQQIHRTRR
jgi:hypothetical protein